MATKKCMKCGGSMKYAKGGSTTNKLNAPKGFAKAQTGGSNSAMGIYGVSNAGPTGNNLTGTYSYKKGGAVKKKLAALAAPKNKITRADIIVGAKKRAAKKK